MNKIITQVQEFNNTAGVPKHSKIIPFQDLTDLKVGLVQEELNEFIEAAKEGNRVEMLDAILDMQVVLLGLADYFELSDILEEGFDRVCASNMSKFCKTEEEAKASVERYKIVNVETVYKKVGDFYVIYRKSDRKILKGVNYKAVELKDLIK
jgi:hypothetical protein